MTLLTVFHIRQVTWSPKCQNSNLFLSESPVELKICPSPTPELNQNVYLFVVNFTDNYDAPPWLNIDLDVLKASG